jgi:head-tail adaptor
MDEQVKIERQVTTREPEFGSESESWQLVSDQVWANAQDVLIPTRSDAAVHGLQVSLTRTRLRIRVDDRVVAGMRVTLYGKGGRLMKIIGGPALLDDRRHAEYLLEGFSS